MFPVTMEQIRPLSAEGKSRRNGLADIFSGMSVSERNKNLEMTNTVNSQVAGIDARIKELDVSRTTDTADSDACDEDSELMDIVHCPRFRRRRNAVSEPVAFNITSSHSR